MQLCFIFTCLFFLSFTTCLLHYFQLCCDCIFFVDIHMIFVKIYLCSASTIILFLTNLFVVLFNVVIFYHPFPLLLKRIEAGVKEKVKSLDYSPTKEQLRGLTSTLFALEVIGNHSGAWGVCEIGFTPM